MFLVAASFQPHPVSGRRNGVVKFSSHANPCCVDKGQRGSSCFNDVAKDMTMKTSEAELDRFKARAKSILSRLKALGFSAGLQQSYELLAAADGHRNWAAMKASVSDGALKESRSPTGSVTRNQPDEVHSELVRDMLKSDGNSIKLNARIYEALGYTLEWKMCQHA
jgi:hypothetical protein